MGITKNYPILWHKNVPFEEMKKYAEQSLNFMGKKIENLLI